MVQLPNKVQKDRKCAYITFALLIVGFIIAVSFSIKNAVDQRSNPPTQISLQTESILLPQFLFCQPSYINVSYPGELDCSFYMPNGVTGMCAIEKSLTFPGCVHINKDRKVSLINKKDLMFITFLFNANITQSGLTPQFMELYLFENAENPDALDLPIYMPFPAASNVFINKQSYKKLNGRVTNDYITRITSTKDVVGFTPNPGTGQYFLQLMIRRDSLTVTELEEVDPLNVTILIGSISGLWGYVTLIWALMFVPIEEAKLKLFCRSSKEDLAQRPNVHMVKPDIEMNALETKVQPMSA